MTFTQMSVSYELQLIVHRRGLPWRRVIAIWDGMTLLTLRHPSRLP